VKTLGDKININARTTTKLHAENANRADLPEEPQVRARSAREPADSTGVSRPAPSRQGPDRHAADPRDCTQEQADRCK
jgi:hypothetical protein